MLLLSVVLGFFKGGVLLGIENKIIVELLLKNGWMEAGGVGDCEVRKGYVRVVGMMMILFKNVDVKFRILIINQSTPHSFTPIDFTPHPTTTPPLQSI